MSHMKRFSALFTSGFKSMFPITTGVIPFGAVVGTVSAEAGFSFFQTVTMNLMVYAGAAQLAAVDLMTKHSAGVLVVITGLVINLRFLLYSAAMSPVLQGEKLGTKLFCAYSLTDQSYAVMSAHQDKLKSHKEMVQFYLGGAVCMYLAWHLSVIGGYAFGNFAPASWSLDYAVPLSFMALVIPTLKNKKYVLVALFSFGASILLYDLPYRLGLIVTALLSIVLAAAITKKRKEL